MSTSGIAMAASAAGAEVREALAKDVLETFAVRRPAGSALSARIARRAGRSDLPHHPAEAKSDVEVWSEARRNAMLPGHHERG